MQNHLHLSISGRIFSRSGTELDQDDPFAQILRRHHLDGAWLIKGSGRFIPQIDPAALGGACFAVWFYRRKCDLGYWDSQLFCDELNSIHVNTKKPKSEPVRLYVAGAVLLCVDRALANYQRGRNGKAVLWSECAESLLQDDPFRKPFDPVAAGRKGAAVRHAPELQLKKEMCELFEARTWPSPRQAATKLLQHAISRGKEVGFRMSTDEAHNTLYGWFREYQRNNPVSHRKG